MTDELTAEYGKLDALQQRLNALTLTLAEIRTILGLAIVPPHVIDENVLSALRQTLQAKDSVIRSLSARVCAQSDLLSRRAEKSNV